MTLAALDPIVLVLMWGVLALVGRVAGGGKGQRKAPPTTGPSGQPETFEELLAEMRGQLGNAQQPAENPRGTVEPWDGVRREAHGLPPAEEVEELESWDTVLPVPVSLETPVRAPGRDPADDRQLAFQETIARRLEVAQARTRGRTQADHEAFDARIRRARPVEATVGPPRRSLRQAIVWREILGKPLALRDSRSE